MSAITALTAQNTLGVHAVKRLKPKFIAQQIKAVFEDIRPDSVKIGMLANAAIVITVAEQLAYYNAAKVVLDPVMLSTSGKALLTQHAIRHLIDRLIPYVDLITPNISELIVLCHAQKITLPQKRPEPLTKNGMKNLTEQLYNALPLKPNGKRVAVLSKGGHLNNENPALDYLIEDSLGYWFDQPRLNTPNTHGTGCTLSSAISANLAQGTPLIDACRHAKKYLHCALAQGLNLGAGHGPMDHRSNKYSAS